MYFFATRNIYGGTDTGGWILIPEGRGMENGSMENTYPDWHCQRSMAQLAQVPGRHHSLHECRLGRLLLG